MKALNTMSNNPVNVLDLGFLKLGKYQNIPGTWNFRPGKYQEKPGKTNKFILYIQTIKNLFKPGLVEIGANCLHCSSLRRTLGAPSIKKLRSKETIIFCKNFRSCELINSRYFSR